MDDDHLPVHDGLTRNVEGASNDREPVDPVMAVAGEGLPVVAIDVQLDAVAVVFDFVNPLSPRRSFHLQGRKLGTDKARHGSLRLLGRCSGTLCHSSNSQKPRRRCWEPTAGQSTFLVTGLITSGLP